MTPRYVTRAEWGARAPLSKSTMTSVEAIILHHTTGATLGAALSDDWVRSIQDEHFNNGWVDIGYSFLYDAYGAIFEGRGWGVTGAHTVGWNSRGHAFAYLGNGDEPLPAAAQGALEWLVHESDRRFGAKEIIGHRTVNPTHCPGDWIYGHRDSLRTGGQLPPLMPTPGIPRPTVPPWPGIYLRSGSQNVHVRSFQRRMKDRGWTIGVDGIFGPETDKVTRQFQGEKHLKVDGVVGPETWNAAWTAPIT